jgi:hypothetical protein
MLRFVFILLRAFFSFTQVQNRERNIDEMLAGFDQKKIVVKGFVSIAVELAQAQRNQPI